MPVDRTLAEGLARTLVDLYTEAQSRLALDLGRRLAEGLSAPDWAGRKLAQIGLLRSFAERLIQLLDGQMTTEVEQAITLAYARGGKAALEELMSLAGGTLRELAEIQRDLPGTEAIQRLAFALVSTLRGTHLRILRWDLDVYREVVASTIGIGVLQGTETRLRTAQRTLDRFLAKGVTGFVDKANRRWELASYVEMAVRTGTAQAAVQGHLDRLGDRGIDLVQVSDSPQECERCRPWEGKVLARTGPPGARTIQVEHAAVDDRMVGVHIAGSVVEAVAEGLLHPNCRHSISGYLPGITKIPTNTEDPDGDEARQKLRALERKVRKEKLQAVGAIDPAARKAHERKARDYQAQIRDHIENAPTQLFRHREREQIGIAR